MKKIFVLLFLGTLLTACNGGFKNDKVKLYAPTPTEPNGGGKHLKPINDQKLYAPTPVECVGCKHFS
jgi:hypothetical protein